MNNKAYIFIFVFSCTNVVFSFCSEISSIFRVHVFGDSHSHACFCADGAYFNHPSFDYIFIYKNEPQIHFMIHWLGPKTMHSIGRDGLSGLNVKNYGVLENDVAVFVLGEIDVRCHIGKQRDQKARTLNEVLDSLVGNYIKTINQNRKLYSAITSVIMSVVPPTDQAYSAEYPFWGSLEDRIVIAKQLNAKLHESCLQNGIKFLDIYEMYAMPNGALNPTLSDENVHVGMYQNYPIKEALVNVLLH